MYFDYPHYPFRRPPELDDGGGTCLVLVIGAGPVGLTAALAVARYGIGVVVVDPKDSVAEGSRAICISRRSFEILQQLDAVRPFVAKSLGWTHGSSYYRGRLVYRLEMPHSEDERFYPMSNIQQQYIEKFLVDQAETVARIDLRWQSKVINLAQGSDGVRVTVDTPAGCYALRAAYVIAADGAHSTVRQCLGLKLDGKAYEGRYLIADIQMKSDYPTERRAFFDPPTNPGSTVLIHKQPDDIWRIDYQLRDDEDPEAELDEHRVRERIARILDMVGERGPWTLEWFSLYKAYALILDDYRHGRVLFAGDAAHLVPIFGVRGLNSGFAEADNLGWKLAWVLNGWAPERLLDSYTLERRAATLDGFANAARSTKFMTPPSRGYRLMRQAALELAIDHDFTRPLVNPRQSTPYDYVASPLTSFRDRDAEFTSGPRAGAPLRNVRLDADDYLLDHLGSGFRGLYFSADGSVPDAVQTLLARLAKHGLFQALVVSRRRGAAALGTPIHDAVGRVAETCGAIDGTFYLVRPDGHVAARWRTVVPNEVLAAHNVVVGGRP